MNGLPPQERSWDDLLGPDRAAPGELLDGMRRQLGLDAAPRPGYRDEGLPDVGDLAEDLGCIGRLARAH